MDFVVSQSSYHYIVISLHNMYVRLEKSQWLYLFKILVTTMQVKLLKPVHEKTNNLHIQNQWRRPASR